MFAGCAATTGHLFARNGAEAGSESKSSAPGNASSGGGQASSPVRDTKMRGLMIDAGRLPESIDYYRRLIEFCADWEYNTVQFRLADDQGSAIRFTSVPGLVNHRNAFTAEQLHALVEYAHSQGIDVIPELESFGHTGFVTRSPRYAHLLDSDARGDSEFSGISPVDPESLDLFAKLYREVAAIFPSKYFHGGCDEVNWGGSAISREALKRKSRARIWADYLNALNQTAKSLGKEFVVWGDFVLHKQPDILGLLAKDIILMDWNYADTNPPKLSRTLQAVVDNGSRCIGAPALSCYRWGARVGNDQLKNVEAFADAYLGDPKPAALGVMVTNWIPSRYLQNSVWDGFSYSAIVLKSGSGVARTEGFRQFVERHYEATWNEHWQRVFQTIYDDAPSFSGPDAALSRMTIPWSNDDQLAAVLKLKGNYANPFTTLLELLRPLEADVKKNRADFQSFQLCVEMLEYASSRNTLIIEQAGKSSAGANSKVIQEIATRDQSLTRALESDWDQGRPADSPAKVALLFDLQPKDELLFQWKQATAYSTLLAAHPERFYDVLRAAATH